MRFDLADHICEVIEIDLTVTNEVTANHHDVRLAGIGHRDGVVLNLHRRDAADVQVGEVRDPDPFEMLEKALRSSESTYAKPARAIVPWVAFAQQLLSKLP